MQEGGSEAIFPAARDRGQADYPERLAAARLRTIESTKERKRDTRRKILAGSWVLARADQDEDAARRLKQGLDGFLTKPQETRALFDLAPNPKTPDAT